MFMGGMTGSVTYAGGLGEYLLAFIITTLRLAIRKGDI